MTGTYNNNKKKRGIVDFNDFRWVLSAHSQIANVYHAFEEFQECENTYIDYVKMIEKFYNKDSTETGNAYLMMALFYFEQSNYKKSLACFMKVIFVRKKDLGDNNV